MFGFHTRWRQDVVAPPTLRANSFQPFPSSSSHPFAAARIPRQRRLFRSKSATSLNLVSDPGNTLTAAKGVNSPAFSASEQVNSLDQQDLYRFTVNQSGVFTANLTGLTGDADIKLVRDNNNNSVVDQGEVIAWQWKRGTSSESIRQFLNKGTYFVQVGSYNNQSVNYNLATNFAATDRDSREFSIQVNFGFGLRGLSNAARNAVVKAAKFWEDVIPYSPFNRSQTFTINVNGIAENSDVLAYAGPSRSAIVPGGKRLPTAGIASINTRYNVDYNQAPDFLRNIMIHELGHAFGIGTLWEDNTQNLIDRTTATYRANSYAGWAFGELKGSFTPTPISVEPSVFGHWEEGLLKQELMTPHVEGVGIATPLSQVTIAALNDLGWMVNYGAAEAYTLPTGISSAWTEPDLNRLTLTSSVAPTAAPTANAKLPIRCGCARHMAGSNSGLSTPSLSKSFNTIGRSRLTDLVPASRRIK